MKKLLPLMKKYLALAIFSPIFMILEVFGDILIPYLMSLIVDVGIASQDSNYIVKIGIYMILVALLAMIFGVTSSFFGARAGYGFASEIRQKTFEKIQSFSFANLDNFSVSSLITRLTNDCNTIGMVTMMSLRMAIRAPFMLIFALIMAFRINSSLARVFLIALPVLAIVISLVLMKARPLFLMMQKRVDSVNATIQENLTAIRVVKSFNRQEFEEAKFKERNDNLMGTALKAISLIIILMPAFNVVVYSTIIAVLWFGGQQISIGSMGGGELISFITYNTQILMSLMMISMYFMQLLRGSASVTRINEVLSTESEITEIQNPIKIINDNSVSFDNVSFCYPRSNERTLKNISFDISSGETLGIIGSTGSSKSTLVQLLPRLYDVSEGSIKVGGVDVRDYDVEALRDHVAFVLQNNNLFSGTIRENIAYGKLDATKDEIIAAAKAANAHDFISSLPDKYETYIGERGAKLSGGQKQRISIARMFLKNPPVLILDEATSSLDNNSEAIIQKSIEELSKNRTTFIIAHRLATIKKAKRIIVLTENGIEEEGSHKKLIEKKGLYYDLYSSQFGMGFTA